MPVRTLTADDVTFTVRIEADDSASETEIRGSFATDEPDLDKEQTDEILARLRRGDETAWCGVIVEARHGDISASDSIWGNVLSDSYTAEMVADQHDMRENALARLNEEYTKGQVIRTVRMCATKYLGATNQRGSRVKATHLTTRKSVTLAWDHALDAFDNHAAAAELLFGRRPELATSVDGGAYMFAVDPANDA